jgi:hypothetical protein
MPRHLLHCGQVDPGLEQITGPGPAQVVGRRRRDPRLAPALLADRPDRRAAQALPLARCANCGPSYRRGAVGLALRKAGEERRAGDTGSSAKGGSLSRKSKGAQACSKCRRT